MENTYIVSRTTHYIVSGENLSDDAVWDYNLQDGQLAPGEIEGYEGAVVEAVVPVEEWGSQSTFRLVTPEELPELRKSERENLAVLIGDTLMFGHTFRSMGGFVSRANKVRADLWER